MPGFFLAGKRSELRAKVARQLPTGAASNLWERAQGTRAQARGLSRRGAAHCIPDCNRGYLVPYA